MSASLPVYLPIGEVVVVMQAGGFWKKDERIFLEKVLIVNIFFFFTAYQKMSKDQEHVKSAFLSVGIVGL